MGDVRSGSCCRRADGTGAEADWPCEASLSRNSTKRLEKDYHKLAVSSEKDRPENQVKA